jgi:hypothetical protein
MKIDTRLANNDQENAAPHVTSLDREIPPSRHSVRSNPDFARPSLYSYRRNRLYATLLWTLTSLFAMRVLGQAVQRWMPQPFLPPFNAFQGSGLPYWLLLPAQAMILAVMVRCSRRVQASVFPSGRRSITLLAWLGWIYMTASLGRIAVGLAVPNAPAWFSTWIPAWFHIVLAGFVLCFYYCFRFQHSFITRSREVQQ